MPKQRKTPKTYNCIHCDTENNWKYSSYNKFCNNRCQQDYFWEHTTKPKIRTGVGGDVKTLRKFLCEERGAVCTECNNNDQWNGTPLVLHVDHIDGNSDNNNIDNLRLLCPNCHSQTETWCGRNTGKKNTKRNKYIRKYYAENKDKWR